jgi:quinol monooxygenase YgiN
MNKQITLIVPVEAKPGKRDEVYKRLCELAQLTRQEEGNIEYIPHEVTGESNSFLIYELWRDQNALDFHMEQDYLKNFVADSKDLLSGELSITFCKAII